MRALFLEGGVPLLPPEKSPPTLDISEGRKHSSWWWRYCERANDAARDIKVSLLPELDLPVNSKIRGVGEGHERLEEERGGGDEEE